ncbi:MAG: very short patch repair endonuclease [Verrucomicrobiia bacterium]
MDVFSKAKRSDVMSRIRSRGNRETEQALASLLRKSGITGWRRHLPILGRPDFVFRTERLAVFVDGCFWHGCPNCYRAPKTQKRYWSEKIARNRARDRGVRRILRQKGWAVMRVWACDLEKKPDRCVNRIALALAGCEPAPHPSFSSSQTQAPAPMP